MKLNVGREFESVDAHFEDEKEAAAVISAVADGQRNKTRSIIIYVMLAVSVAFLVGAALLGLWSGSFNALQMVWIAIAPISGVVVGHYFPVTGEGNGKVS